MDQLEDQDLGKLAYEAFSRARQSAIDNNHTLLEVQGGFLGIYMDGEFLPIRQIKQNECNIGDTQTRSKPCN